MITHVLIANIHRFVDNDPRDSLVTSRLRERTFVCHVFFSVWYETADWEMSNPDLLTFVSYRREALSNHIKLFIGVFAYLKQNITLSISSKI